jgi:tetratricopeptide (TPR) repeat protein
MNLPSRNLLLPALMPALLGPTAAAQPAPGPTAPAWPDEARKAYEQGGADLEKKAYDAALRQFERALTLAPDRAEIWNAQGICLRNLRRFPAAVRAGWRAIQLDHGRTLQPWVAQANTLMETRAWASATACLEKAEALQKDRAAAARSWLNLAFRMMAAGESDGVVAHCQRATKLDPENPVAWMDLGQAQSCAARDPKAAQASLEKALALAEQRKDGPQAGVARQLLDKVQGGTTIRPEALGHAAWQVLPAALLTLPEADASQLPLPGVVEHRYALTGGGTLAWSTPEAWCEAFAQDRPESRFTVQFTVPGREGFKVLFSPLKGIGNPLGVKATADKAAQMLKEGALEDKLTVEELSSPVMRGYWTLSTNKAWAGKGPIKGAYHHMLNAQLDVGGLQCAATVFTNAAGPDVVEPCLAAFRSARRLEAGKP